MMLLQVGGTKIAIDLSARQMVDAPVGHNLLNTYNPNIDDDDQKFTEIFLAENVTGAQLSETSGNSFPASSYCSAPSIGKSFSLSQTALYIYQHATGQVQ